MKVLPVVAVLLAAFTLPSQVFAQSDNVKPANKNSSSKFKSAIFKGSGNLIESNSIASFIGGGQSNTIFAGTKNNVIGGGFGNVASGNFSSVGGGGRNTASGESAAVAGGYGNTASGYASTVGGGEYNTASNWYATVGGGYRNTASAGYATVAGGEYNTASAGYATVGGGYLNTASGARATIGGGYQNNAVGPFGTIAGGYLNLVSADRATVGGGGDNAAVGLWSTVPGGVGCRANHEGSFVWSGDGNERTASFGNHTFTVRCEGGARFYTGDLIGVGVQLGAGQSSWASLSDSNAKTKITAINPRKILAKVVAMPVTEWEYKEVPDRRYIGPMAQDFHAAFGLSSDDKSISTLDSDGVMYAAIQGLVEELKDRDRAIEQLKAQNNELSRSIKAVNERLDSLPPQP